MNAPLATIELDAFCERCGFNLRSQQVRRDETLGLLVCQCPECGTHQSAVGRATALTPWLHRLALLGMVVWVGVSIAFVGSCFVGLIAAHVCALESLSSEAMVGPSGERVQYGFANNKQVFTLASNASAVVPGGTITFRRDLVPWLGGPPRDDLPAYQQGVGPTQALIIGGVLAGVAFVAASLLATGSWFWRPRRRWYWLALPTLATATYLLLTRSDDGNRYWSESGYTILRDHAGELKLAAAIFLAEVIIVWLGLRTGRSVVRGALLVFAPPGARQLFAFLWHCDGKTLPVTAGTATPRASSPPDSRSAKA